MEPRLFMVGGPGGVGKTTLAAALGLQLAKAGHRTVVLTVDPARRLAQALGLQGLDQDLQKVPLPPGMKGELHASMLDTQRYFDRVIDRFAKSPEQKEKILRNPLYRITVDSLGGTHEYAAMERLLEFAEDRRFERVVIDTPPSQNALDLLSAPQRLADFMDSSVLRWFQGSNPGFMQIFRQGTRLAMKLLQKVFGSDFLSTLGQFMDDLEGMHAGFRERHLQVISILRSPETAFWLVTFPSEVRYRESMAFSQTLKQQNIPLSRLILNRLEPACPATLPATIDVSDRAGWDQMLTYYHSLHETEQHWVAKFRESLPDVSYALIPRQRATVQDVDALLHLGQFLKV